MNSTLFTRLSLAVAVVIGGAAILFLVGAISESHRVELLLRRDAEVMAGLSAKALAPLLEEEEEPKGQRLAQVSTLLDTIIGDTKIDMAAVVDENGTVLAQAGQEERSAVARPQGRAQTGPKQPEEHRLFFDPHTDWFRVWRPILSVEDPSDEQAASLARYWLRLDVQLIDLRQWQKEIWIEHLLSAVLSLGIGLALIYFALRRPVREIAQAADFAANLDARRGETLGLDCSTKETEALVHSIDLVSLRLMELSEDPHRSDDRLAEILNSISEAFFAVDRGWRLAYVNSVTEKLFSRPREAFLGKVLWEEFPEFASFFFRPLNRAMNQGQAVLFDGFYPPTRQWLEVRAFPSTGGLTVFCLDVSERKAYMEELRFNEERLRTILESAAEAIVTVNEKGVIQSFNTAAENTFGYSAADVIGLDLSLLLHEPDAEETRQLLQRLSPEAGTLSLRLEGFGRRKEGEVFPMELSISQVRLENQRLYTCFLRDISQRKEAERLLREVNEQLEEKVAERTAELQEAKEMAEKASASKSAFLTNMSHELRTPLNAILGFSDVMRAEVLGPMRNQRYLGYADDIYRSGSHLLDLINDILDLSKAEAGKMELEETEFPVETLFEDCLRMVGERAKRNEVSLDTRHEAALPHLCGDNRKLRQVLLNLLTNAIKFSPAGGQVTLASGFDSDGNWCVRVEDTGIGITPEDIAKVMEPFGQVRSPMHRDKEGTGIGLPLSKVLVEMHGGRLTLSSVPDQGTTVEVCLPARRVIDPADPAASAPASAPA